MPPRLLSRRQQQLIQRLNATGDEFGEAFDEEEEVVQQHETVPAGSAASPPPPRDTAAAAAPPPPRNTHQQAPAQRRRIRKYRSRKQKPSKREIYHRVLVYFMRHHDNIEYEFDHQFTQEQLQSITPTDLIKYFKYRCYGNPDADAECCYKHKQPDTAVTKI